MKINWHSGHQATHLGQPELQHGDRNPHLPRPPLTQHGNIQYLDFIEIIGELWTLGHPEISYQGHSIANIYDPEKGYLIYSLVDRVTKDGMPKPKYHHTFDNENGNKVLVFIQSFITTVKFTAIHPNPKVADEIIEEFETFMMECTPLLKEQGIEDLFYFRRIADDHNTRIGIDVAARAILYRATFQKILEVENEKLESLRATISILTGRTDEYGRMLTSDLEIATPNQL